MLTGGSHFVRENVASYLIFVFFLGCVSVCARARMVITAFLIHLLPFVYCDYFSTIPISVYAFSLFNSGFVLTSQPFFLLLLHLVVANLAHSFAIQFSAMLEPRRSLPSEFHPRNFHPILVHNLFGIYNCFSLRFILYRTVYLRYFDMLLFHTFSLLCGLKFYYYFLETASPLHFATQIHFATTLHLATISIYTSAFQRYLSSPSVE